MSLLNRSYFFKSDHTDTLPFVSLTIILSSLILVSMFPTFVFFCLSDKTSDKRFHHSLSISYLVRNLWSSSASLQQSFTFLILKSFVHGTCATYFETYTLGILPSIYFFDLRNFIASLESVFAFPFCTLSSSTVVARSISEFSNNNKL